MIRATILGLILMLSATGVGRASFAGIDLVSLDGALQHHSASTDDYAGHITDPDASVAGVYREGPGTCWLTNNDGSKLPGDPLLDIDEIQGCLSTESI